MCGIFFYYGNKYSLEQLKKNFLLTTHRGPDVTIVPYEVGPGIFMGFHRLCINGLDDGSNQPIVKDDVYLICNGEMYFHNELNELHGLSPDTHSDCEIILSMYLKFGIEETLRQVRGEFGFVLADLREDEPKIYAARDSFGCRQMYYSKEKKRGVEGWMK